MSVPLVPPNEEDANGDTTQGSEGSQHGCSAGDIFDIVDGQDTDRSRQQYGRLPLVSEIAAAKNGSRWHAQ